MATGGRALPEGLVKMRGARRRETSGYNREEACSPCALGKQSCWKERCALAGDDREGAQTAEET